MKRKFALNFSRSSRSQNLSTRLFIILFDKKHLSSFFITFYYFILFTFMYFIISLFIFIRPKENERQVLRIPLQEQDEYASYKAQFITDNKIFLLLLFHIFSRRAKDKLRIVEEKILVLWRFFYCRKILLPDSWRIFCLEIYWEL